MELIKIPRAPMNTRHRIIKSIMAVISMSTNKKKKFKLKPGIVKILKVGSIMRNTVIKKPVTNSVNREIRGSFQIISNFFISHSALQVGHL